LRQSGVAQRPLPYIANIEQFCFSLVIFKTGRSKVVIKNERVELEMKIMKYRAFLRQMALDPETEARIQEMIADLESRLRSIDE
jgi:hypothetical protein